jgi:hypothetical protein
MEASALTTENNYASCIINGRGKMLPKAICINQRRGTLEAKNGRFIIGLFLSFQIKQSKTFLI